MNWLSIIGSFVSLVQTLIKWASDKQLLDAGAKAQLAGDLLKTAGMVADADKISEWVDTLPDDVITGVLQRYYTRD